MGRGSFALVLEARDLRTGELCCVKKLPKYKHQRLPCQQTAVVAAEAAALRVLSAACPASILRFHEVRQDTNYFYIVTEASGGRLLRARLRPAGRRERPAAAARGGRQRALEPAWLCLRSRMSCGTNL